MKTTTRKGMTPVKPLEPDVGLKLDRQLNAIDIYLVEINGKDVVGTKSTIDKFTGTGRVKMRFINKDGRNTEHYK